MPARHDYANHIHDCFSDHRRASEPLPRQRNFPFDRVGNVRLRTRSRGAPPKEMQWHTNEQLGIFMPELC